MTESLTPLSNDGFSLVPAIFVPFHGIPADKPLPKDRDEKLKRILEDLDKHQDAVRRNMLYLAALQKEKLLSDAREAMKKAEANNTASFEEYQHENLDSELQKDIKDLLESLKEPAVRGTSGKEYEYEDGDFDYPEKDGVEAITDTDGDAAMCGMESTRFLKRNIHRELNKAIQDLVMGTAAQIAMYDKHAETTKEYYRRALERHNAREGLAASGSIEVAISAPAAPATVVQDRRSGGILRQTASEIRVDTDALARMAKEDQSFETPSHQVRSAIDVSRDSRRSSVDFSRDPRRSSVQFAQDSRKVSMGGNRDIWRR